MMNPRRISIRTGARACAFQPQLKPGHVGPKTIRVLLAEDHPVVRMGISAFLSERPNLQLVGEAADGLEALKKAKELLPDIVITDVDMPHLDGFGLTRVLRRELPQVKVILLSGLSAKRFINRILQSGARGFLSKEASAEEMTKALELVSAGDSYFSPEIAQLALNQYVDASEPDDARLSQREQDVVILIAEGLSNKEIAVRLDIGTRTVETHRERIMKKLNVHSIAGLTTYAVANDLIRLPGDTLG